MNSKEAFFLQISYNQILVILFTPPSALLTSSYSSAFFVIGNHVFQFFSCWNLLVAQKGQLCCKVLFIWQKNTTSATKQCITTYPNRILNTLNLFDWRMLQAIAYNYDGTD
jgi:hypothetical protein